MTTNQYIFAFLAAIIAGSGYLGYKKKKLSQNMYTFGFAIAAQFLFLLALIPVIYPGLSIFRLIVVTSIICLGTIPVQYYVMKITHKGIQDNKKS